MPIKKDFRLIKTLSFLSFSLYLLTSLPVLPLLHAQQVRELDIRDKWVLSVRNVPIALPPDYKPSPEEAERAFRPSYQVLILKTPGGSSNELPLTDKGLFPVEHNKDIFFYPFMKARFGGDWNNDSIPEIILTIAMGGYYLKNGRANPTEPDLVDYLISFKPGVLFLPGSFKIIGSLGSISGISSDVYPVVLPQSKGQWPQLYQWTIEGNHNPGWSPEEMALNVKIACWFVRCYVFKNDKYEEKSYWKKNGFTTSEDLNKYSTDLLRYKGEYLGPPTVYLRDDKVFLRAEANSQSKSLGLLKTDTSFYLLAMQGPSVEIGGALGPWLKVLVQSGPLKGKVGWVFGAYISPWNSKGIADPAPKEAVLEPTIKPSGSQLDPVSWTKQEQPTEQTAQVRELDRKANWVLAVRDVPVTLPSDAELAGYKQVGWDVLPNYQVLILQTPRGDTYELRLTDTGLFPEKGSVDMFFYPLKKARFGDDMNNDGIPEILISIIVWGYRLHNGVAMPADHKVYDYWISFNQK